MAGHTNASIEGVQLVPSNLARAADKGVDAIVAFLDLRTRAGVTPEEHERGLDYAKVGCAPLGASVRFMAAVNNAKLLALQEQRQRALTPPTGE